MNLNPAELLKLLNPVFNALDGLIENYDVNLYLGFVSLVMLPIGWILSGVLRRKQPQWELCRGHSLHHCHAAIAEPIRIANH